MPEESHPVRDFFSRMWSNILVSLGTTTLSLLLFSLIFPAATSILTLVYEAHNVRKPGQMITASLFMAMRDWLGPTLIGIGVLAIEWLFLLVRGFTRTVKADQLTLLSATESVKRLTLEFATAQGFKGRVADLENQLAKLTNQFSGRKWDNFMEKINSLTFAEKHVLYHFVLKGCHMLEHEALQVLEGTCLDMPKHSLNTIYMKTGLIAPGFNGYDANQGIVMFLEHWASSYNGG